MPREKTYNDVSFSLIRWRRQNKVRRLSFVDSTLVVSEVELVLDREKIVSHAPVKPSAEVSYRDLPRHEHV
eukprot:765110-Hanusia_phi.AAC.3